MSVIKFGATYKKPDPDWDYGHGFSSPKYARYNLEHRVVPCLHVTWEGGLHPQLRFRMFTADRVLRAAYVRALRAGVSGWEAGSPYPAKLADHLDTCTDAYAFERRSYSPYLTIRWQEFAPTEYCDARIDCADLTAQELADKSTWYAAYAAIVNKHGEGQFNNPTRVYHALRLSGFHDVRPFDSREVNAWREDGPRRAFLTDPPRAV